MNQEEADQDVADEVSEEVDPRACLVQNCRINIQVLPRRASQYVESLTVSPTRLSCLSVCLSGIRSLRSVGINHLRVPPVKLRDLRVGP